MGVVGRVWLRRSGRANESGASLLWRGVLRVKSYLGMDMGSENEKALVAE